MKIRFLRTIAVDIESAREGVFSKSYSRWDEVKVSEIFPSGRFATVRLDNGDFLHGVPVDSFEKLEEAKKAAAITF
jgi:hypothetical protein